MGPGQVESEQRPRILTELERGSTLAPFSSATLRSRIAASLALSLGSSSKNDSRVSFGRGPPVLRGARSAVLPMTRGTSVWLDSPRNCLISTASTSMRGICSLRNFTTCSNSSGISSAMNKSRSRRAARFVATPSQKASASGSSSTCSSSASTASGSPFDSSNVRRSSSAVHVCAACAAYSNNCPTIGAAEFAIRAALHLGQRRHRVLVNNQMVQRPPRATIRRIRDPLFARDQNPAPRIARTNLLTIQQLRMLGNQRLKLVLGRERLLLQRLEPSPLISGVYPLGHVALSPSPSPLCSIIPRPATSVGASLVGTLVSPPAPSSRRKPQSSPFPLGRGLGVGPSLRHSRGRGNDETGQAPPKADG